MPKHAAKVINLQERRARPINSRPSLDSAVYFWHAGSPRNRTHFIEKLTVKELYMAMTAKQRCEMREWLSNGKK